MEQRFGRKTRTAQASLRSGMLAGVVIALIGIGAGAYFYTQAPQAPPQVTMIETSVYTSTIVSFSSLNAPPATVTQTVTQTQTGAVVTQTQVSTQTQTQVSTQTQTIPPISTVKLASDPIGVGYDSANGLVYVALSNATEVMAVSPQGSVVATIPAPAGSAPFGVAVNPNTNTVYVTLNKASGVAVISGATNAIIATIPVGAGPSGVAVNPTTNTVFVGSENDDSVSVINGATNTLIHGTNSTVSDATFGVDNAYSVAVNPLTNTLYVGAVHGSTKTASALTVVNASTTSFKTIGSYTTFGGQLTSLVFDPANGMLYIANPQQNLVNVFSTSTNSFVRNITLPHPSALVLDSRIGRILAVDSISNYVTAVSTQTNSVTGTVPVGNDPMGIDLDSTRNLVYVANSLDGTLTVLPDAVVP